MIKTFSVRINYLIGFLLVASLLGMVQLLQIYDGLTPCSLCLFQRVIFEILCLVFLLGALLPYHPKIHTLIGLAAIIIASVGFIFAGRQAWLQHWPVTETGVCGIGLDIMFKMMPWTEVIKKVWQGGLECSQVGWKFLSLTMAEWSLLWFAGFIGFGIVQLKRR